jgi:hypothetical protein
MESLLILASVNAVILYCVFNKWSDLSKSACVFCIFFWFCVLETVVFYVYKTPVVPDAWEILYQFGRVCLLTVFSNIAYFFIKHLYE